MTPNDVLAAFEKLALPIKMRAAAVVHEEASLRERDDASTMWSARDLRRWADDWEREDAEKAKADQEVEELARELWEAHPEYQRSVFWHCVSESVKSEYLDFARRLVKAGYRKAVDK